MQLIDITPAAPDTLPSQPLAGPARVVQCPGIGALGRDEILWAAGAERALFRILPEAGTGASADGGTPVTLEGARAIVRLGIRVLGTDATGILSRSNNPSAARALLDAHGVVLLEGLALADVPAGDYELIVLPRHQGGGITVPVSAVLRVPE